MLPGDEGSQVAPRTLRDKLTRYRPHLALTAAANAAATANAPGAPHPPRRTCEDPVRTNPAGGRPDIPFASRWRALGAQPYHAADDACVMVREVRHPVSRMHGAHAFAELQDALSDWEAAGIDHPLSGAGRAPEDLLFFDTETTGLHGGTGNTVFLLGYARFEADFVVVRQHILIGPQAETALYESFLQRAGSARQLVTFNGKAFDWPQVKTRHTLLRSALPALPSFGHTDLLHAARRLWADELTTCRLSTIETVKLGVRRTDDVPGHMAPLLYFEFLRAQDPDVIAGVLAHNELDVLTLVTLYIHLSTLVLRHTRTDQVSHGERFAASRWYESLGRSDLAARGYRVVANSRHPLRAQSQLALGRVCKRAGDWQEALSVWERCAQESSSPSAILYVELAKICEHQAGDCAKALQYAHRAYDAWKRRHSLLHRTADEERGAHLRRIERLERKLASREGSRHLLC